MPGGPTVLREARELVESEDLVERGLRVEREGLVEQSKGGSAKGGQGASSPHCNNSLNRP